MTMTRAVVITLLLSGCTTSAALQYAYNNAGWFVLKEVDARTCPTLARRARWEREVKRLLRWHRSRELPRYARLLRDIAKALDGGISRADFDAITIRVQARIAALLERASPSAAALLATRDDTELTCLTEKLSADFDERIQEAQKKDRKLARDLIDRTLKRIEGLTGAFSEAQKSVLAAKWALTASQAIAEAKRRQRGGRRLLEILKLSTASSRRAALNAAFQSPDGLYNRVDAKQGRQNRLTSIERVWDTIQVMNEAQRRRLARSARSIAETLERLAGTK